MSVRGSAPRDGDPHRGAVAERDLHLARLGVDRLDLAQRHVAGQLVAPPSVAEDAVGLLDDDVAFEVVVAAPGAALALGAQRRVEGLSERLADGGREPVPEQVVLADDRGVGLVPVAVDRDEAVARPVAVVPVVVAVLVEHFVSPSCQWCCVL